MQIVKEVEIPKQVVSHTDDFVAGLLLTIQPPGKYAVLADVNTTDKERITCMTSTVFFSPSK